MTNDRLNILLIADVGAAADHSSVEGLFTSRSDLGVFCQKIFFQKKIKSPQIQPDRAILPYKYRRRGLLKVLGDIHDLRHFHVIVVRNLYNVLAQILGVDLPAKVGFWESFPHSHRRVEAAVQEGRAVLRKRIEYYFASRREKRLIQRCDFFLPITATHRSTFYPDVEIPCLATPMGFDFDRYPIKKKKVIENGPIRFVYIGSVDALRRFDIINSAFQSQASDFVLDYYSASRNDTVNRIRRLDDRRIRFHGSLARSELFEEISSADVGVCFFPHTKTHITASPTKTLEYGALGLTALVNPMPEYRDLLDDNCVFLCDFSEAAMREKISEILKKDRETLFKMGRILQQRVFTHRNYARMAENLFAFLRNPYKSE